MLMVHGARITASPTAIAVSIRFNSVWLQFQEMADFASLIHSQPTPPPGNREGAIDVTVRKQAVPELFPT
jgi:hypothetical protein